MSYMRKIACIVAVFVLPLRLAAQQDVINTVIGGGPNNMPATDANLNQPYQLAFDAQGNYFVAAAGQNRVFRVNPGTGVLTVFAGTGVVGYSGDGDAATNATLSGPQGIAVDGANPANVYISDTNNCVVRLVNGSTGIISTIAGGTNNTPNGCSYSGDNGAANLAQLSSPSGLALNLTTNDLYIADFSNGRIRKVVGGVATGTISTVAGGGVNGNCGGTPNYGDGGKAINATLCYPGNIALDTTVSPPNVFISNNSGAGFFNQCAVREVIGGSIANVSGNIYRVAGSYSLGCGYKDNAANATNGQIYFPYQLQVQVNGSTTTVWIADYELGYIRQFTVTYSGGIPAGANLSTVAGSGTSNFCGDGGPPKSACIGPVGLALDSGGNLFIGDYWNNRIRAVTAGIINTVAGWANANSSNPQNNDGNPGGTQPLSISLYQPFGVFVDGSENVFVADASNDDTIREWVSGGNVNTYAGNGTPGYAGDGSTVNSTTTQLNNPNGVVKDSNGNTYISDTYNCVVRMVNSAGTISTIAGGTNNTPNGCGYSGDGGSATNAHLNNPYGLAVDGSNNLYIADTSNNVIREVQASTGIISTVAGTGIYGYNGDGGPATNAYLRSPYGVAVDRAGNLFIADTTNHRIREVNALTQTIQTVAGNGTAGFSGDGPATQNSLSSPNGVTVDANGNLFIADTNNVALRWVDSAGNMTTFAGNGNYGFSGDGGLAINAMLAVPTTVSVDSSGNIFTVDQGNARIREISALGELNRSTSSLTFPLVSVGSTSQPQTVTLSAVGPLTISNISVTGDYSESDACPPSLTNGQTCMLYVYFAPKAAGTRLGSVTINDSGFFNSAPTVNLTGTGSAISIGGSPVSFGNQTVKVTSGIKSVTIKNNGSTPITMSDGVPPHPLPYVLNETTDFAFAVGGNTCPAAGQQLAPKGSCTIGLTFTPQSTGLKKGAVIVSDNDPTTPQVIGLSGTGTSLVSISPASIGFAAQAVGTTSASSKITLTNKTTNNSLTLGTPAVSVTGPYVKGTGTTCTDGLVLTASPAAGSTCVINVQFSPTALGYAAGSVSVSETNDSTSPQTVALSGIGTAVKFTPPSVVFAPVTKGTQATPVPVTITNVGTRTITFTNATLTGTNSPDFSTDAGNPPCGSILPGKTCTFNMFFTPSKVGAEKATYKVFDNSPGSPQSLALSGTGQ
jgi:sugar lactone lactonase YvrE